MFHPVHIAALVEAVAGVRFCVLREAAGQDAEHDRRDLGAQLVNVTSSSPAWLSSPARSSSSTR